MPFGDNVDILKTRKPLSSHRTLTVTQVIPIIELERLCESFQPLTMNSAARCAGVPETTARRWLFGAKALPIRFHTEARKIASRAGRATPQTLDYLLDLHRRARWSLSVRPGRATAGMATTDSQGDRRNRHCDINTNRGTGATAHHIRQSASRRRRWREKRSPS